MSTLSIFSQCLSLYSLNLCLFVSYVLMTIWVVLCKAVSCSTFWFKLGNAVAYMLYFLHSLICFLTVHTVLLSFSSLHRHSKLNCTARKQTSTQVPAKFSPNKELREVVGRWPTDCACQENRVYCLGCFPFQSLNASMCNGAIASSELKIEKLCLSGRWAGGMASTETDHIDAMSSWSYRLVTEEQLVKVILKPEMNETYDTWAPRLKVLGNLLVIEKYWDEDTERVKVETSCLLEVDA